MKSRFFGKRLWVLLMLYAVISVNSVKADSWWNEQWQYRKKIAFDTTAGAADIQANITGFPVLVRLHTGNFNFANASDSGEDLRFIAADDQTLLKHHVEKFDVIDEIAYIWVRLPKLSGSLNQDFIWMYYGNKEAVGGQDSAGTFDAQYVGVYHLGEFEGMPKDATAYNNHVTDFIGGQGLPAVIGSGLTLTGAGDHMMIPVNPSLDFSNGFTFSSWIRIQQPQNAAVLFSRRNDEGHGLLIKVEEAKVCVEITAPAGTVYRTQECPDLSLGTWHYFAVTVQSNSRITLYLDGLQSFFMNFPDTIPNIEDAIYIGTSKDGTGAMAGDLDEVRISNVSRAAEWVRAGFKSQGPEGLLLELGMEEINEGGGMPIFYLGAILKNITLDGWLVIGSLGVLSIFSWIAFISKTVMIYAMEKENTAFKSTYEGMPDPLTFEQNGDTYENSSLYQIFSVGLTTLKTCIAKSNYGKDEVTPQHKGSSNSCLDSRSISAIKASMEKGFIEETKKLNAWLVLLTMAISGGPFLGLLGTVWGVMNTFAAMAEAGEANIMAIAPGVASALSTTVIGLIVAIPALFGYNYLTEKIKTITADMMITVDQFTVNVDEIYGISR